VQEFLETILTKHDDKVDPKLAKEAQGLFARPQVEEAEVGIPFWARLAESSLHARER
jgi:hypothetical protein